MTTSDLPNPPSTKRMRLRFAGRCRECSVELAAGTLAVYHRVSKTVACVGCVDAGADQRGLSAPKDPGSLRDADLVGNDAHADLVDEATHAEAPHLDGPGPETDLADTDQPETHLPVIDPGAAGASALREYHRRKDSRETRIREAHPRLGGLILALSDEPQTTKAWATGARGEEVLGRRLDGLTSSGARVLHDRRIPRSRANIDHIVVGPAGVFVIDAKRYAGRPSLRVEGGILRPRTETLIVGRRDCTKQVDGVHKQIGHVRAALERIGLDEVPVMGMLCFVEADWPLFGGDFVVSGVHVLWPKKVGSHVLRAGGLDEADVADVHRHLASAFASS